MRMEFIAENPAGLPIFLVVFIFTGIKDKKEMFLFLFSWLFLLPSRLHLPLYSIITS